MEKLANFCFSMPTNTKLLARLKAGFFVREVYERFIEKSNGTLSPDRKLWIYSAHDSTIANILNTLGLFEVDILVYELFFDGIIQIFEHMMVNVFFLTITATPHPTLYFLFVF